jgi:predicted PurR-regulated permease PerM/phosphoglycolate phosphatase-like HAD superfamily hydrolase
MVSPRWSTSTKRMVTIALVVGGAYFFFRFAVVMVPLAIAAVVAYVLHPLVTALTARLKASRTLVTIAILLIVLIVLALIPALVVPRIVSQLVQINVDMNDIASQVGEFLAQPIEIWGYRFVLPDIIGRVQDTVANLLAPFASRTVNLVFGAASILLWVAFVFVVAFYLIRDAPQLSGWLDRLAPEPYRQEFQRLRAEVSDVWDAFFRGQVVLGIVVGTLVWLCMTIVGLPNAGVVGLLAGLLEVIPNLGPILASIPALLIAFFQGSLWIPLGPGWFTLLVGIILALIQQVENVYIVPRVMSRRLRLHPLVVLVGVVAGGLMVGAIGVFLAAPVIATARVLLAYLWAKLLDVDPYPAVPSQDEVYPGEIDALLLDLDGTLVETDDQVIDTVSRLLAPLARAGLVRDTRLAARRWVTAMEPAINRLLAVVDRVGLDDPLFRVGGRLHTLYHGLLHLRGVRPADRFVPVDGAVEAMRDLAQRYRLAIVTTRSRSEVQAFLSQEGVDDLVEVITGRDTTWRLKPHPEPIEYTAEQLGVPVYRCLLVGDTTVDMRAAAAAGAPVAGVLSGFGRQEDLEASGANLIVATIAELSNWL